MAEHFQAIDMIIRRHGKGPDRALWSVYKLGKAVGLSHIGVQRIWAAHGLKPHLTMSFKLSNDLHFKTVFNDCMLGLDLIGSYRFLVADIASRLVIELF